MQDKIHVVVDTIAVSNETPLKDDPRCHVLRLIARHGNEEWWDGDRSLEEMFAMVEKTGQLPGTSQPPVGYIHDFFSDIVTPCRISNSSISSFAALYTCSSLAPRLPYRIFSITVPVKRFVS